MLELLQEIRGCQICADRLPHPPRPVLQIAASSQIIIIGQAPGRKVHESGVPWDDASGNELRRWLGVDRDEFYDPSLFGLVPMGFCYPGKGRSGDLPPQPECAPAWHARIFSELKPKLTILIGQYSQSCYLGDRAKSSLTETIKGWQEYWPDYLPLVHPSPRNRIWQKRNPWFESEIVPTLQRLVSETLSIS